MEAGGGRRVTGRLAVFYVVLALVTAAVTVYVIDRGAGETAQPSIAGGYDVSGPNPCLGRTPAAPAGAPLPPSAPAQPVASGPQFDVQQSGQFVNLSKHPEDARRQARLHPQTLSGGDHRLTGSVSCVNGTSLPLDGVAVPGLKGTISGRLGGGAFSAGLKRDPHDPGTPLSRIPSALTGTYKLSSRSTCFGGTFDLAGSGRRYRLSAKGQSLGTVAYAKATGGLAGDVSCARGGHARLRAAAVDLNLNNVTLTPLDTASPVAVVPAGDKPVLTTPSGLSPAGEKFTAVKQRSEFSKLVAAFFLAVMIVIVVARLFGVLAVKVGQPRVMGEVIAGICLGPSLLGAISPTLQSDLFPSDILPAFGVVANLGLIFYMFLIGLELDRSQLKGRVVQATAISNASLHDPKIVPGVMLCPACTSDPVGPAEPPRPASTGRPQRSIVFGPPTASPRGGGTMSEVETGQAAREASGAHPYGRYLEEFEVGAVYKHWPAKTVTESDDHLFCLITMNHHPLHLNDVYAAASQQRRNVVVGPLVYSLALGMSVSDVSGKAIANLATDELRHPAPVFHGDTLFCESEVLEKRESKTKPDRGTVRVHTRVLNQDGVLVAEFKRLVLVPRRTAGTAPEAA